MMSGVEPKEAVYPGRRVVYRKRHLAKLLRDKI